ncbi:MAG: FHA domain-containing protein [Deltaproteobacteria bacterium]|nr:FHA domain-containing protein [Deltaproteobacteria bacterium]
MARLDIRDREGHLGWVAITRESSILGRDPSCHIVVNDEQASRRHGEIVFHEGAYWIRDLDSTNGTYVNGERIDAFALTDGDNIRVGTHIIVFRDGEAEEAEAKPEGEAASPGVKAAIDDDEAAQILRQASRNAAAGGGKSDQEFYVAEIGELLQTRVAEDSLCLALLDLVVRSANGHRAGFVFRREDGDLAAVYARSRQGDAAGWMPDVDTAARAVDRRMSFITGAAPGQQLETEARSVMVAPLRSRGRAIGAVVVESSDVDAFDNDDLRLLTIIGDEAGYAVTQNRLARRHMTGQRMEGVSRTMAGLLQVLAESVRSLKTGSELVQDGIGAESFERVAGGLEKVKDGVEHLSKITHDLSEFVGETPGERQAANINELVGNVMDVMRGRAEEANVEVEVQADESVAPAHLDPMGVYRAIKSLVHAGLKAATKAPRGKVIVATAMSPDGRHVLVRVKDNGPGLSPDNLQAIFEAFPPGAASDTMGLELAVAYKIIRDNGGEIRAESAPGDGCEFTVRLPVERSVHQSAV